MSTRRNTYQYKARITGLAPATRYYCAIHDGERRIAGGEEYFSRTSPPHGSQTPTRIWVVGDSGTGGVDQRAVRDAMRSLVEAEARPLDTYIHVGDMAYGDGTDKEFQRRFFDVANIHFVCLDSHDLNRKPNGAMAQWLHADFEKTNSDWLIAFWHHPPYTKRSHGSDREGQLIEMRTHIMPILVV